MARGFRLQNLSALIVAPILSVALICVLGILFYKAGFHIPALALLASSIGVGLIVWVAGFGIKRLIDVRGISEVRGTGGPDSGLRPGVDTARFEASVFQGRHASGRDRGCDGSPKQGLSVLALPSSYAWRYMLWYVLIAAVLVAIIYGLSIGAVDAFSRNDDSTVHLGLARSFLDTGIFSTLHANIFLDVDEGLGWFYPSAFSIVCALVASFIDGQIPIAFNAVIVVTLVCVFPLSMLSLMSFVAQAAGGGFSQSGVDQDCENVRYANRLTPLSHAILIAGGVSTCVISGFPWGFLVFGQLLPNMVAFMFVPALVVVGVKVLLAAGLSRKLRFGVLLGIGWVALVCSQPNGLFTWGIWFVALLICVVCAPRVFYGVDFYDGSSVQSGSGPDRRLNQKTPVLLRMAVSRRVGIAVGITVIAVGLWAVMYQAPFMQGVVNALWKGTFSKPAGIAAALLGFPSSRQGINVIPMIFAFVGVLYSLRRREHLWLTVCLGFAAAVLAYGLSSNGVLKHILTGFWYTDMNRTGAMEALFAMPLVSIGAGAAGLWVYERCSNRSIAIARVVVGAASLLVVALMFVPVHVDAQKTKEVYQGLPGVMHEMHTRYSWDVVYTADEQAFVREAKRIIEPDAFVINVPQDGTCWVYGVDGLNLFYRRSSNTGSNPYEAEARVFREHLAEVSADTKEGARVREALRDVNAHYVLLLDSPHTDESSFQRLRYKSEDWVGIESITEDTPGFELVLSDDDKRLYRILDE